MAKTTPPMVLQQMGLTYIPAGETPSGKNNTFFEKIINSDSLKANQLLAEYVQALAQIPDSSYDPRIPNQLVRLQKNLRDAGYSKDKTTPTGYLTEPDLQALQRAMKEANANKTADFNTYLLERVTAQKELSNIPTFSKSISTAIRLIDKAKGQQMLSEAFYRTYGYGPSQAEIQNFTNKWNASATKNASTTTTSTTTSGKGFSKSASVTTAGFETDAQQQLISDTLKKNLKLNDSLSGQAGEFVKQLQKGASDNLLPAVDNNVLANTVARIIGQTDATVQKQMIADELQKFRNQAAQLHPGAAVSLKAGLDYSDVASPYKSITAKRGLELNNDDPLIASMVSVKDKNGTFRNATLAEADSLTMGDARWLKTPNAISTFGSLANDIRRGGGL